MERDSLGKVASQIQIKCSKFNIAKPLAGPVKERLKRLSQSEQVKQNEHSAKEAAKLVKPITAHDKRNFNKRANR